MYYKIKIGNKYEHEIYCESPMTVEEIIEVTKDNDSEYALYDGNKFEILEAGN